MGLIAYLRMQIQEKIFVLKNQKKNTVTLKI